MSTDELWQWRSGVSEDRTVVSLAGEIDLSGAERLREVLREPASRPGVVDVDLARVTFIDSSVINLLNKVRGEAVASGGGLRVVNPTGPVRRVLDLTGVLSLLSGERPDGSADGL